MSIHYVLILNRQGKTRLSRWYDKTYSRGAQNKSITEIHRLVSSRDSKHQSNFIEYQEKKLVYRRYAGLYFIMSIDINDSELAYLESLHFFVEILDVYFDNVCELDLVFNFYKLYAILDEVYLGGEIHEVSKSRILARLTELDRLE
ncbi:AP-2 complex subunit sigma [Yamadazyma tenuis]|uniref:AP complex subunit sigma n=1 Tax=Candida tenuis (strain ATCC 10573 / BCRC 21748 / CBS 615 / JCM 9827 / NBRC 10315 / NRRL Y-1498 / VKM Y-70) TaxID=590646 RepID=G3B8F3_CANTC|nr:uncharacterized protein CANTEDRAFT_107637 [Yamadazyma tenuis ATCC 10573]EGV62385.1 hypothetical protein CANTEDRAFT_107637 [Yamadazyma tenuis ATCC 10573]WEJ93650.1 AP-2 complex subunit sigma [Yamadazyma tenuis]